MPDLYPSEVAIYAPAQHTCGIPFRGAAEYFLHLFSRCVTSHATWYCNAASWQGVKGFRAVLG